MAVNQSKMDLWLADIQIRGLGLIWHLRTCTQAHMLCTYPKFSCDETNVLFWVFCWLRSKGRNLDFSFPRVLLLECFSVLLSKILIFQFHRLCFFPTHKAERTRQAAPDPQWGSLPGHDNGVHFLCESSLPGLPWSMFWKTGLRGDKESVDLVFIRCDMNLCGKCLLRFPFPVLKYILHEHVCVSACAHVWMCIQRSFYHFHFFFQQAYLRVHPLPGTFLGAGLWGRMRILMELMFSHGAEFVKWRHQCPSIQNAINVLRAGLTAIWIKREKWQALRRDGLIKTFSTNKNQG